MDALSLPTQVPRNSIWNPNLAISLDGGDYITRADGSAFDFEYNVPWSVGIWAKSASNTGAYLIGHDGLPAGQHRGWNIIWNSAALPDGTYRFALWNTSTYRVEVVVSSDAYRDDNWHHVLVTYSGTGTAVGIKIYVDGAVRASLTWSDTLGGRTIKNAGPMDVGACNGGALGWFTGVVRHGAIWNRVLSAPEVLATYGGGTPPNLQSLSSASALLAWWKLGTGDSPSDAYDQIASRTLTNVGGTIVPV